MIVIVDAEELYDEAQRELGDQLLFGWRDDMIHEYIVERLAGVPVSTARYRAVSRTQPRKYRPSTEVSANYDFMDDVGERLPIGRSLDDRTLETIAMVTRAIRDIRPDQQTVIRLRYGIDEAPMGPSEIARETGMSLSKVERLLRRAKIEIARRLQ